MNKISENIKKGWQILLTRSNFDKKVPFEITRHAIDEEKQDRELNREIKRYLLALDRKERIYHRIFSFLIFLAGVALFLYGKDKPDVANIGLFILGAALYGYAPEVFDKRNLSLLTEQDEDKPQLEVDVSRMNKSDEESFSIKYNQLEHKENILKNGGDNSKNLTADNWVWLVTLFSLAFIIVIISPLYNTNSNEKIQFQWIILGTLTMFFISICKRLIYKS
ncbi:MAG: hypothetical protein BWK80_50090 [Desulfobacteraceae bacterium IS3]|nr:MAG: hypothetical protein BWK80_50090 [Desulfobacteraceae bacterium IS3]